MPVEVRLPTVLRPHAGGQVHGDRPRAPRSARCSPTWCAPTRGWPGQVLTEDGTLHRFVNVYVDDDDVRYLEQLDTKVADGDTVSILPAVAGG